MKPKDNNEEIFDVVEYLNKEDKSNRYEKVVERGEECGWMYSITRKKLVHTIVIYTIKVENKMAVSVTLMAEEKSSIMISDITSDPDLLRFEFAKRLPWWILDEAEIRHKSIITGKVPKVKVDPVLFDCFRRYGFKVEREDANYSFYLGLK